ncbi:amino acid transporter [Elizabethkingia meningoseptica]|uniref:peptide MFS transporter n=1 Tax=Elizabethkingia meningoseptica TaxID=238 RepID=UPI000332CD53|nr:peptide MFS transporter [Elizabethkingia meningoseptica]AQX06477.1 amino acid transporter [Elizabethkingia meningoseptica]AQX48524.1 amino acid transporter [Elizabethkingia meningoseptica]EOR29286.1 proton-dependent peptide transporter [Elizabethkingia meningoseptica ATCC 13253 = NBRC 12535]KUY16611.1 amino acid transporter [Elizabethkingia meningoseptica]OPB74253.1 amino acid transporter [Elizabethkingia meningoseptica]
MKSKHPKGLPYLFFTEMWERFGYYLILGIFVLYMIDPEGAKGGLGFPDKMADDIFGTYIALTYLTPFLGGFLADRVLGYVKSIYLGGILMAAGYIGLGLFKEPSLFYTSLALIIIGNGFFKPTISTVLGNLYSEEPYKANKDSGYNIFYMGINIGAFICNIIAAFMRNKFGWGEAFITAGVGMLLGLVIFSLGRKHIRQAVQMKPAEKGDTKISDVLIKVFVPAIIAGVIGWIIPGNIFGSDNTDAFIFACIPVIYFYISLYFKAKSEEKRPIGALLLIFMVSMFFWAIFKQNGTALTRWANYYTDRTVPAAVEKPLENIYLVETKSYETKEVTAYDDQFRAKKDADGKTVKEMGKDVYFKNISPEERAEFEISPKTKQNVYLYNTELFQSINPFWVIVLTPVVVGFWTLLRRKGKEPSTPTKIVLGLFITALSCLVMVGAAYVGSNGEVKVSALWLVASYGVVTVGELCLSPMGLSVVSKLSPPRITALMMGGFFLANSVGNKLSGILASTWYNYENKEYYFLVNFGLLIFAFFIGLLMLKFLNKVMKEKGLN